MTDPLTLLGDTLPYNLEGLLGVQAYFNDRFRWLQITVFALLLAITMGSRFTHRTWRRVQVLTLAACWLFGGLIYQRGFVSMLDWSAHYTAWLLVIQGLLMAASELPGRRQRGSDSEHHMAGKLLMLTALLVAPVLQWLGNTPVTSISLPGLYPDLTALFSAGWMLARGSRWWLWLLPLGWMTLMFAIGLGLGYIQAMLPLSITLMILLFLRLRHAGAART